MYVKLFFIILLAAIIIYVLFNHRSQITKRKGKQGHCPWPSRKKNYYKRKRNIGSVKTHMNWPWFVRLEQGISACGGSLVDHHHVLTAAHCFDDTGVNTDNWKVYVDVVNQRKLSKPYVIKEIKIHEDYGKEFYENDIALLTLKEPVQFSDSIYSVCLPTLGNSFPPGTKCWVAGFKITNLPSEQFPDYLKEMSVEIIDQAKCNAGDVHEKRILPSMLCAGDLKSGQDACIGDSGGPLMCEAQDDVWYLAGIVSWGVDCGRPNKPGVYTNVLHFLRWIREQQ
ncbi:transmembrane protease serine 13b [Hoplias malabaricus]|uniref:transmembrane protease serine 13b n=1 Tax=Hoplias malabaricus TaxID=27720 RepID=UPI003463821D